MRLPVFSASFENCWPDLDLDLLTFDITLADLALDPNAFSFLTECLFGEVPIWVVSIQWLPHGEGAWGRIDLGLLGFGVGLSIEQRRAK